MKSIDNFSKNLAKIRSQRGVSLREFSEQIGVSFQVISKIETGESRPTLDTAFKISEALSITLDKMLE